MYQNIFVSRWAENSPAMVYVWDDEKGLLISPYNEFQYAFRKDPKGQYTSLYGNKLKKIIRFKYDDLGLFESDLPKETRVLTDLYLDSDTPSKGHRVLNYDIEVSSVGGFALPEIADKEITAIANHDSLTNHYTVFLLDPDGVIENSTEENETVISCKDEYELLTGWLAYYKDMAPTIITGWNINKYDIPYTFNRLKRVLGRDSANSLSPINIIEYNQYRDQYQIAGVSCLDYIALYKKYVPQQKPSYRLDAIGKDEVGMGKIEYEGTLDDLFKRDIKEFLNYNLRDVKIVVAIDKKKKFIELARAICHAGHVQYEDFAYSSKFIEGTIITYLHRKNIIAPNKPVGGHEAFNDKMAKNTSDFIGAFVKEPVPGLYEWVYSLDLTSLYPSIIMSLNISPETKAGRVINWEMDKHIAKTINLYIVEMGEDTIRIDYDEFIALLNEGFNLSSNGILYRKDKLGVIPEILDSWFKQRKTYKKLMLKYEQEGNEELTTYYDLLQSTQKIFLNSCYGVLGLSIFRFYDLDNAAAVTTTGQDVIKTTAKFVNRYYNKTLKNETPNDYVIYVDTDSVYVSAIPFISNDDSLKIEETVKLAKMMEEKLNSFYDVMADRLFNCSSHRFSIKGEGVMSTALWVAKKRYAMKKVYDLEANIPIDKLTVKGLDVVRSSYPPAFQKFMKSTLDNILQKQPKSVLDSMILGFFDEMKQMSYTQISKNTSVKNIEMHDDPKEKSFITFPKGVAAHVKASITYNRFLRYLNLDKVHATIKNGDKIKWTYLKTNPYGLNTIAVKMYDDPQQIVDIITQYIDYNKLFEKELSNKLEDFYSAMKWGYLPTKMNQTALKFFTFD